MCCVVSLCSISVVHIASIRGPLDFALALAPVALRVAERREAGRRQPLQQHLIDAKSSKVYFRRLLRVRHVDEELCRGALVCVFDDRRRLGDRLNDASIRLRRPTVAAARADAVRVSLVKTGTAHLRPWNGHRLDLLSVRLLLRETYE